MKKSHDIPRFLRYPLPDKKFQDTLRNLRNTRDLSKLDIQIEVNTSQPKTLQETITEAGSF